MTPIRATVRLQLHGGFDFDAAVATVPYYAALGASHLYLSPIAQAVPGSTHGYDGVDPTRVSDALGGEAGLRRLHAAARAHGMGLVLDIVPNHVAAHADNPWWWDVLRHGRDSGHAAFFDIEWDAPGADGRLQLPVLDRPLVQAIADGVLDLVHGADGPELVHHDLRLPLHPATVPDERQPAWIERLRRDARAGGDGLLRLVDAQAYRPLWWRVGHDRINVRRFFDITSLVALRVERREVFDAVHALPLRLVGDGIVDGLRVDHVDGLAAPRAYCRRLRTRVDTAAARCGLPPGTVPIWVEKILAPGERLRSDWRTDGTSGYDAMELIGAVQHDPRGEAPLQAWWQARSGRPARFGHEESAARREMLAGPLQAERARALRALAAAARHDAHWSEFAGAPLARSLDALLASFPVYRTYASDAGFDADDMRVMAQALQAASKGATPLLGAALDALASLLGDARSIAPRALRRRARRRVEQLSAPLNAKAVEDTAFYRHGVLLSRNEVGAHPARFGIGDDAFHAANIERAAHWPRALLATATHDHKRGEDVRARLAVLSEDAAGWAATADAVLAHLSGDDGNAPSPGDAAMALQTIVGAWPPTLSLDDGAGLETFARRVVDWQRKAVREAKLRSTWTEPDAGYEAACAAFVQRLLCDDAAGAARRTLHDAAERIACAGALNGLAQATLRLTLPGVPDLYQGTELWDLSLVDPDNRRPVDHAMRQTALQDPAPLAALLDTWRDGRIKQRVIARLLALRRAAPGLFAVGDYTPLSCGDAADGAPVLAFGRAHGDTKLVVAVPRLASRWLGGNGGLLPSAAAWDARVLPLGRGRWRHALDDREFDAPEGRLPLTDLFATSPVAVLVAGPPSPGSK